MNAVAVKSFFVCAFGAAMLAGCASSPPAQSAASTQGNVQSGKVTAVETVAVVDQSVVGSSSGGSAVVTTASGGPSVITVQFNDGKEGRYIIERPTGTHAVGEQVYVITDGDRTTIVPR
jgi:Tfp pilus assembly protein PilX